MGVASLGGGVPSQDSRHCPGPGLSSCSTVKEGSAILVYLTRKLSTLWPGNETTVQRNREMEAALGGVVGLVTAVGSSV